MHRSKSRSLPLKLDIERCCSALSAFLGRGAQVTEVFPSCPERFEASAKPIIGEPKTTLLLWLDISNLASVAEGATPCQERWSPRGATQATMAVLELRRRNVVSSEGQANERRCEKRGKERGRWLSRRPGQILWSMRRDLAISL
jgi:hypothetical protein